jgi:exodeoxyribonuclease-3
MDISIISWNINGLQSSLKRDDIKDLILKENPDILCLSETKLTNNLNTETYKYLDEYKYVYFNNSKIIKGYAGTCIFSKIEPINVIYNLDCSNSKICELNFNNEGRIIILEFNNIILINVYTPNSGTNLKKLKTRIEWEKYFRINIKKLQNIKPVIICGDLNVAHNEIDIKNPKQNINNAGFTIEERNEFSKLLKKNVLIDVYRYFNTNKIEYTYWTYKFNARINNIGWRIDYFLTDKKHIKYINNIEILTNIYGSDHAPVKLTIKYI